MCPGRDPDHHLTNAEEMFDRIQKKIDEGDTSDFAIGMLKALKGSRDVIRASIVKFDLQTGQVVDEAGDGNVSAVAKDDAGQSN